MLPEAASRSLKGIGTLYPGYLNTWTTFSERGIRRDLSRSTVRRQEINPKYLVLGKKTRFLGGEIETPDMYMYKTWWYAVFDTKLTLIYQNIGTQKCC